MLDCANGLLKTGKGKGICSGVCFEPLPTHASEVPIYILLAGPSAPNPDLGPPLMRSVLQSVYLLVGAAMQNPVFGLCALTRTQFLGY